MEWTKLALNLFLGLLYLQVLRWATSAPHTDAKTIAAAAGFGFVVYGILLNPIPIVRASATALGGYAAGMFLLFLTLFVAFLFRDEVRRLAYRS
jgi:hypothetical protein